jgi:hypothetical protein
VNAPRPYDVVVLRPCATCPDCRGTGTIWENHGAGMREPLECECAFSDLSPSEEIAVEHGRYMIVCRD